MGISTDVPSFPVVDRSPSFTRTVANFNMSDLGRWGALTATGVPVGYYFGRGAKVRVPSMWAAGALGAFAGFLHAYQLSAGRLMGRFENTAEAKAAGLTR